MHVLILVAGIWHCIDCKFDIKQSSMAAPIGISIVQMILMYISIISKNQAVFEVILDVRKIVERRKLFWILHFCQHFL